MDRGAWWATVHRIPELDTTEWLSRHVRVHAHTHTHTHTHTRINFLFLGQLKESFFSEDWVESDEDVSSFKDLIPRNYKFDKQMWDSKQKNKETGFKLPNSWKNIQVPLQRIKRKSTRLAKKGSLRRCLIYTHMLVHIFMCVCCIRL